MKHRILRLFLLSIILTFFGIFLLIFYRLFGFGIPCIIHVTTGIYCPGCGTFRAIYALFQFDFLQALHYNIFIFIAFPFIFYCAMIRSYCYLFEKPLGKHNRIENVVALGLSALGLLFTIFRNIPAFSFLAPV